LHNKSKFIEKFSGVANTMGREYTHQSVILLINGNAAADNRFVKQWLRNSRFLIGEATDIFQALEELSDFTVCRRPDVILLEVDSLATDFLMVREMVQNLFAHSCLPILALSESGKILNHKDCFEGNLTQLKTQLEKIFPKFTQTRIAA